MKKISILYTCFNRKEKTLKSLKSLYKAIQKLENQIEFEVYLTDDGSTDGTSEAIRSSFSEVQILKGSGQLFWANGMINSWKEALKNNYDGYLLLNDDTELYENSIEQLLSCHVHSLKKFNQEGIYIGATEDKHKKKLTYSGSVLLNKFLYTQKRLAPNGDFQYCDLANANIMLVSKQVVDKIGILSTGYDHGIADYDYTLMASQKKLPVIIAPEYCGHCEYDHIDFYVNYTSKTIKERKELLYSPTKMAFKSNVKYMKKFFPLRLPFYVFFGYFKLYFPKTYLKLFRNVRR
ncbi:glycosyltransferase family 2 protein [Cellulophaga sp. HaHaR_3_176]|uniref:glycosyltransferase family 2 protein n=1 Tax=Cellulophaga sp. HaHaR_3_176 TaxID=1942464 RepID=UPI001C1FD5D6|nr:glycosyltransferase [Cellulophaga sp. HaHaR_3_176]QWX84797.1 glycosyltransferase family 2 protein [Cellulophaga sp. HaHaR_3_176]